MCLENVVHTIQLIQQEGFLNQSKLVKPPQIITVFITRQNKFELLPQSTRLPFSINKLLIKVIKITYKYLSMTQAITTNHPPAKRCGGREGRVGVPVGEHPPDARAEREREK